jgi:hypothetical protein
MGMAPFGRGSQARIAAEARERFGASEALWGGELRLREPLALGTRPEIVEMNETSAFLAHLRSSGTKQLGLSASNWISIRQIAALLRSFPGLVAPFADARSYNSARPHLLDSLNRAQASLASAGGAGSARDVLGDYMTIVYSRLRGAARGVNTIDQLREAIRLLPGQGDWLRLFASLLRADGFEASELDATAASLAELDHRDLTQSELDRAFRAVDAALNALNPPSDLASARIGFVDRATGALR